MRKISSYKLVCILLAFLGLVEVKGFAQVKDSSRWNVSADVIYSQKYYVNNYLGQLITSNNISFGGQPKFIGVQISGTIENHNPFRIFKYRSISASISQMIPCDITVNDSINAKLTGVNFSLPFLAMIFFLSIKLWM